VSSERAWQAVDVRARARLIVLGALALARSPGHAASFAEQLDGILRRSAFQVVDAEVPILTRTVARSADFPVAATTPNFTYRFNFETGVPERVPRSMGPAFVETGDALPARTFEVGAYALHVDADERDGEPLEALTARFNLIASSPSGGQVSLPGQLQLEEFDIDTTGLVLSGNYGFSDRLEAGIVVPALSTAISLRGQTELRVEGFTLPLERVTIDDTKVGIGDVIAKAKYVLTPGARILLAPRFSVRLPTGDEDNFQGLGDLTLTPGLSASTWFGPHGLHGSLAFDVNTDDLERCRVRYGFGAGWRLAERVALLTELVGSSGIADDGFTTEPRPLEASVRRSDVVHGTVGLKIQVLGQLVAFVGALVPLTEDGVRAEVIPTGGLEMTF
jgi:hypothetical protein